MAGIAMGSLSLHGSDEQHRPPTRGQSVSKVCKVCGDAIGVKENGEIFVACHVCAFPVCRPCYEYERSERNQCCPQCNTCYKRHKGCPRVPGDSEDNFDAYDLEDEFQIQIHQDHDSQQKIKKVDLLN